MIASLLVAGLLIRVARESTEAEIVHTGAAVCGCGSGE